MFVNLCTSIVHRRVVQNNLFKILLYHLIFTFPYFRAQRSVEALSAYIQKQLDLQMVTLTASEELNTKLDVRI